MTDSINRLTPLIYHASTIFSRRAQLFRSLKPILVNNRSQYNKNLAIRNCQNKHKSCLMVEIPLINLPLYTIGQLMEEGSEATHPYAPDKTDTFF